MTNEHYSALHSSEEEVRLRAIVDMEPPASSEDVAVLVPMLSDTSWRVRKAVVQVLAQAEVSLVVPHLMKALNVGNIGLQNVRFHNSALECLVEIGPPTIPALTAALQAPDKDTRIAAANVLGAIHHPDACDALIQALHDPHINVRYAAVEALSKIPSQKSVIPLTQILEQDEDWLKLPAISALGHIGDYRATPHLMTIAEQPLYLQTVVEALGNIGDEQGIPCIIRALSSTDKEVRKSAVMAMETLSRKLEKLHAIIQTPSTYRAAFRSICSDQILHSLIELMDEHDFQLVLAAIKLLGWSGRQEAAYALLEKLEYEQLIEAVSSAVIAIGSDALTPLAHAYDTTFTLESKLLIIDCFQEIGGKNALHFLLHYLQASEDEDEMVTHALLKALNTSSFIELLKDHAAHPDHDLTSLLSHLKRHKASSHPLIRAEAIYVWGQLQGAAALDELLEATKDVDPAVRVKAIKHVEHFAREHPDLIDHLIILLSDDHPHIRKQAAQALGHTADPRAFPALLLVVNDSHPMVQQTAVAAISDYLRAHPEAPYHHQALEKLAEVLEKRCRRYEDGLLKIEICQALQQIEAEQSTTLLLQLAHDMDFDVRKSAILTLGSFQTQAASLAPVLTGFLTDAHWSVREAAVTALGSLQVSEVKTELLAMIDDPDLAVRRALLVTLGRIGSVEAIPTLIEFLANDDLNLAAYQGLKALVAEYESQIAAYLSHENPKVHLLITHLLGRG
ncbi:hypothetical protein GF339_22400 [candidate division KSB3 bacterium]|uniref:TOG domain-containing protein n=1 Tax=candidate division KSB3 bacterium TaxID=2044937 RepID=A0A9D5JZR6_9BACT|nr:hypothetical protein [candidate division KSB3 bacterium]MBD3327354.1 hypothetical protein [candidate division KSB3 bacterium]